ncbi:hypothetical protein EYZ11_001182 [Aspergillus tanneri]|uniref:Uncharacterized protein n=1 Tax=Aspergillus tanneri TaxID=1220188 RepID=A0A4V3UQJ2_9EURO|nr:hypothetical protein EYZ11_001182 [Aspergillus tanneri]
MDVNARGALGMLISILASSMSNYLIYFVNP